MSDKYSVLLIKVVNFHAACTVDILWRYPTLTATEPNQTSGRRTNLLNHTAGQLSRLRSTARVFVSVLFCGLICPLNFLPQSPTNPNFSLP